MKLSDQALGAIMLALQNSLMNQTDIVPTLKNFNLMLGENEEIIILNPPTLDMSDTPFQENKSTVGSD
tara:strand:- start:247 stop:450 length:204 start_codon:yes stop_codon:yes gene_type:complete